MKFNKSLIIILLLLIFCISFGAVSAADNADMSVNDINNDDVATVENSVNVDGEISTVSEGIPYSSEIYDEIKSATGTYNITGDYQIDITWEILNANVIIEGNNYTIYGNSKRAFNINGNNVIIKNLNFVDCRVEPGNSVVSSGGAICGAKSVSGCSFINCNASFGGAISSYGGSVSCCSFVGCSAGRGGAIFSDDGSVSGCSFINCNATDGGAVFSSKGSVSGCSFVGCSAGRGGAICGNVIDGGSVSGCSFINCNATDGGSIYSSGNLNINKNKFINSHASSGGAIYFEGIGSVNYCIFDNNDASVAKAIFGSYDINYDFNFFSFKNDRDFPKHFIEKNKNSIIPNIWVVLEIITSGDSYFVNFVTDEGNNLSESMPDYTARLSINGVSKDILIKNNNYNDTFVPGNYVLNSLNSGNILANRTFNVPSDIPIGEGKDNGNGLSNSVGNMENCGNPLIALLIALICLSIIRRK